MCGTILQTGENYRANCIDRWLPESNVSTHVFALKGRSILAQSNALGTTDRSRPANSLGGAQRNDGFNRAIPSLRVAPPKKITGRLLLRKISNLQADHKKQRPCISQAPCLSGQPTQQSACKFDEDVFDEQKRDCIMKLDDLANVRPERAEHISPGQGVLAAALGLRQHPSLAAL